jgi:dihydrofolate reductase
MGKVRVAGFTVSVDGFGAGPGQDLEHPLGAGGEHLHGWLRNTATFRQTHTGESGGERGVDDTYASRSFEDVGAWIMGRNMFGPVRGPWGDSSWRGWWGENPVYHTPVFVLTHHPRPPLEMEGGTTFHFLTGGIEQALDAARAAAAGRDVRIGGGVETVRQYLAAGLIDEMHLAISPAKLGQGENLLQGIDLNACGLSRVQMVPGAAAMHVVLSRG